MIGDWKVWKVQIISLKPGIDSFALQLPLLCRGGHGNCQGKGAGAGTNWHGHDLRFAGAIGQLEHYDESVVLHSTNAVSKDATFGDDVIIHPEPAFAQD